MTEAEWFLGQDAARLLGPGLHPWKGVTYGRTL
jgi:hypothetical protein